MAPQSYLYTIPGGKPFTDPSGNASIKLNPYAADLEIQYINNYHIQNKMLQNLKDFQSINDTKVTNLKTQIYNLNFYNFIVVCIYLGLVAIFILFLFIGKKMTNWNLPLKIVLAALLILFPFFITFIEQTFLKIISFCWNLFNGSPYISPSY